MDRDRAADLAGGDVEGTERGHALDRVAHRVGAELGPPLAPEVLGHQRPVDHREDLGQLLGARRDAPVVLAHAEDVVAGALALLGAALDLAGLPHRHADLGHDQAEGTRRAGHGGHDRIGPAVLGGDDEPVGRQVPEGQLGRPRGVVDLHRDERDLEVTRQALRLVEMERLGMRLERIVGPGDRDTLLADGLDLLGPRIDHGDVVAGPGKERADVASDRAGADEQDLLGHVFLPVWCGCRALSRVWPPEAMGNPREFAPGFPAG